MLDELLDSASIRLLFRRLLVGLALGFFLASAVALEPPLAEMVKDIDPHTDASGNPQPLYDSDGILYFHACDEPGHCGLWKSDGTASGTVLVRELDEMYGIGQFAKSNGLLYFVWYGSDFTELFVSDGTFSGTKKLTTFDQYGMYVINPSGLTDFGNTLFLVGTHWNRDNRYEALWKVVNDQPTLVKRFSSAGINVRAGKLLFFSGHDSVGTEGLWVLSEGNNLPNLLHSFLQGAIEKAAALGETLYFVEKKIVSNNLVYTLWKSDGTMAGTVAVKGIGSPNEMFVHEGMLYFTAWNDDVSGLWKTDGTPEGTVLVKSGGNPYGLTSANGTLFFATSTGVNGSDYALWRTDGVAEGGAPSEEHTAMVKSFALPSMGDSSPRGFVDHNGILYFSANQGSDGFELWRSDGTPEGTFMVRDINPSGSGDVYEITSVGSTLYFSATDGSHGRELWKLPLRPASVRLSNLTAAFDNAAHAATCVTEPAGLTTRVVYNGSPALPSAIGSYKASCTVTDPGYTGGGSATLYISANPQAQAITDIRPVGPLAFSSGSSFTLSGTGGASGNPIRFSSASPAVCTISGNVATMHSTGTCLIAANQSGNADYLDAPQVTRGIELVPGKTNQSIAFVAVGTLPVGSTSSLIASASSGLPVAFSSLTNSVCTASGQTVAGMHSGTCTVAADQAGDVNYHPAPQVVQSFEVQAASAPTVPDAPSIVRLVPGAGALRIVFLPPANDGGAAISQYTVNCEATGHSASASAGGSPITVVGLNNGLRYTCGVRATNSKGSSAGSAALSAIVGGSRTNLAPLLNLLFE